MAIRTTHCVWPNKDREGRRGRGVCWNKRGRCYLMRSLAPYLVSLTLLLYFTLLYLTLPFITLPIHFLTMCSFPFKELQAPAIRKELQMSSMSFALLFTSPFSPLLLFISL